MEKATKHGPCTPDFSADCTKDLERTLFIVVMARDVFTMKLLKISP